MTTALIEKHDDEEKSNEAERDLRRKKKVPTLTRNDPWTILSCKDRLKARDKTSLFIGKKKKVMSDNSLRAYLIFFLNLIHSDSQFFFFY